jgi:2-haloacid dehalogenase
MWVDRREFVTLAVGSVVAANAIALIDKAASGTKIKAVAFDGFPIIDPRPLAAKTEEVFPARGLELGNAWRTRQFEYTWLRTLGGHYADFWQVTEESLHSLLGYVIAPRDAPDAGDPPVIALVNRVGLPVGER